MWGENKMALSREEHEALLTELADGNVEESRKYEILQSLRNDSIAHHEDFEDMTNKVATLTEDNKQLQIANSRLFREQYTNEETDEEVIEQDFSESITVSDLEESVK